MVGPQGYKTGEVGCRADQQDRPQQEPGLKDGDLSGHLAILCMCLTSSLRKHSSTKVLGGFFFCPLLHAANIFGVFHLPLISVVIVVLISEKENHKTFQRSHNLSLFSLGPVGADLFPTRHQTALSESSEHSQSAPLSAAHACPPLLSHCGHWLPGDHSSSHLPSHPSSVSCLLFSPP